MHETWSFTITKQYRLRVREYGAEKYIWASEEAAGGWRKLHYKLHNVCSSPHVTRATRPGRMRRTIYVAHMGENKNAYRAFASKTARKRPLGKTGHRGENKIKMDLKYGWVLRRRLDSTGLEWERFAKKIVNPPAA